MIFFTDASVAGSIMLLLFGSGSSSLAEGRGAHEAEDDQKKLAKLGNRAASFFLKSRGDAALSGALPP